jgi:DNA-binding MarR family transcriptional regulator
MRLEFRALLFHCRAVAMPVNRPQPSAPPTAGPDGRLYLRDQELDQGAALIRAASRRLSQLVLLGAGTVSAPEIEVLEEILDRGPMDVTELRRRLVAPKQSLTRNLNQLEARGLVARRLDPRDKRRRLVTLTDAGQAFAQQTTARRRAALRQAFLAAGPEAVTGARRVLQELLQS